MFKNPLKYQSGGSTPTQQQQDQLVQLFQAAAQNAQVDPEALVKKAQELGQDENAAAQFMEGLQRCAQGDPAGIQFIKSLFTPSHKRGGKIQDFICKHGKVGAVAGCGCEKPVEKHQDGKIMPYTRGSYQSSDYFNNVGSWIKTPKGLAQNYRPYTFGGRRWGFGGNDLEQILVVPGENDTPRRAVRRISNWFNPDVPTERLDTTYQDANGNRRNSAEFEARVNRELEGVSGSRPTTKENGGKVEKAQEGTRSLYQRITADGPETYVDGYGTVREMHESPIITGLRKAYHWINGDQTLSDEAYLQKYGYSKPIIGMPPPIYISPVAQEINLAKYIGFRTPTQASLNQRGAATIKAEADRLKAIEAATKEGRYYVEPKPSDLDMDKSYIFNSPDYTDMLSKIRNIKFTK